MIVEHPVSGELGQNTILLELQKTTIFIFSPQLLGNPELKRDTLQAWQIYKGHL